MIIAQKRKEKYGKRIKYELEKDLEKYIKIENPMEIFFAK